MQFIDLKKQQSKIKDKINQRISNVLKHGKYIMGPEVFELEKKLAAYVDTKYCISCSSGTDALLMSLMAKKVGSGDAIITSPFTYIATAEAIQLTGATPVFVDIESNTYNINFALLEDAIKNAIKKNLSPKGIIPIDLFGLPANYNKIENIAKKYNLFILEDAAQSFGSEINGKNSCSFGSIAATSFFPAKPLGCYGDGGAIFTNDDDLADKLISIRVHGSGVDKYDNIRLGLNGRLDTLQAAVLLEKLEILDEEIIKRNNIAKYYSNRLSDNYKTPFIPEGYVSAWAQYSIILDDRLDRTSLINYLSRHDIPSMIYYKIPLHLQKVFSGLGYDKGDFPISESCSKSILSIPMHPYLENHEQNKIIEVLNSYE